MENVYTFFNPPVDAGKSAKAADGKTEEQSRWNPTGQSGPQPLQSIPFLGVAGSEPSHFPSRKKSEGGQEKERSPERSVTEQRARRAAEERIRDRQTGHGSQADQPVPRSHCQDERPETQVDGQTVPGGPGEPCVDRRSRLPPQEGTLEEPLMEERHSPAQCGTKPEPPPQRTKPCLSTMTQRHLQDSSDLPAEEDVLGYKEREANKQEKKGKDEEGERGTETKRLSSPVAEKPTDQPLRSDTPPTVTPPKETASEKKVRPPVPPASSKPTLGLADTAASLGEDAMKASAPMKPQRNRKAFSCETGMERDCPGIVERPSDRKPPVKKPRLPQSRNRSLDSPGNGNSESANSEVS